MCLLTGDVFCVMVALHMIANNMNFFLQDLRLGSGTTFRFDVRARDLGSPSRSSDPGRVTVFVRRNSNGPYFINTPYIQALERNTTTGKYLLISKCFHINSYPCVVIYGFGLSVFFLRI